MGAERPASRTPVDFQLKTDLLSCPQRSSGAGDCSLGHRQAEQEDDRRPDRRTRQQGVLGQRTAGVRHTGARLRAQGLRRAGPYPGRPAEARRHRSVCGNKHRGRAAQGGGDDRPDPARSGPGAAAGAAGADGGGPGRALHDRRWRPAKGCRPSRGCWGTRR